MVKSMRMRTSAATTMAQVDMCRVVSCHPLIRYIQCYSKEKKEIYIYIYIYREREREREIKIIGLFGDRGHRGPYTPYKSCNHNLYIGIIIFPHIDNPQSTGYNHPKKKQTIKMINEKSEGPINLTNHWRKILWISLHVDLKRLN